jgi:ATP/maltotriose-dependent transcriptional regulator MalT
MQLRAANCVGGIAPARRSGDHRQRRVNLADTYLETGDVRAAGELLEAVQALAGNPNTSDWMRWSYSLHIHASASHLWFARGDTAKATQADCCAWNPPAVTVRASTWPGPPGCSERSPWPATN